MHVLSLQGGLSGQGTLGLLCHPHSLAHFRWPKGPTQFPGLCPFCATCLLVTDHIPLSSVPPFADDVLTKDAGECVICLEELLQGDTIARLPCLCIYHKRYGRAPRAGQLHLRPQKAPSLLLGWGGHPHH